MVAGLWWGLWVVPLAPGLGLRPVEVSEGTGAYA